MISNLHVLLYNPLTRIIINPAQLNHPSILLLILGNILWLQFGAMVEKCSKNLSWDTKSLWVAKFLYGTIYTKKGYSMSSESSISFKVIHFLKLASERKTNKTKKMVDSGSLNQKNNASIHSTLPPQVCIILLNNSTTR